MKPKGFLLMNRFYFSTLVTTLCLLFVSQALALDGYRDRRGLFYGVGFGGGQTKADVDGADGHIGYNFRARIGGGIDKELTLEAEIGLNSVAYSQSGIDVTQDITTVAVGGSIFVKQGLYIRAQGGIADMTVEVDLDNVDPDSQTGLFMGVGAGYEFFANADLAIGLGVDFQHQMYDDVNLNALNLGITANWY